jgi:hypothetical protein
MKKMKLTTAPPADEPAPRKSLLTKVEIARELGVNPRTVSTLMKRRTIPYIKLTPGDKGDVRFDLTEVLDTLKRKNGIDAAA